MIKFNILTNSNFWKVLCDVILKLGEIIKMLIEDNENNDEV